MRKLIQGGTVVNATGTVEADVLGGALRHLRHALTLRHR